MGWQFTHYSLLLAIDIVVALALAGYAWRRRVTPGAHALVVLLALIALWSAAYAGELVAASFDQKVLWAQIQYLAIATVPLAWLLFALTISNIILPAPRRLIALLSLIPAITIIMAWTNRWHGLLWSDIRLDTTSPFPALQLSYGIWFWINWHYAYAMMFIGTLLLIRHSLQSPRMYRWQIVALVGGTFAPWLGNLIYVLRLGPVPYLDLTPFMFTLAGGAFAWSLLRFKLLDVVPVARDTVIAGMRDGVIVLNLQQHIVDLNPAARRIFGKAAMDQIGQHIRRLLPEHAHLLNRSSFGDINIHLTQTVQGTARNYNVVMSALQNEQEQSIGYLIVLHDITDRTSADHALRASEARYRAVSELTTDFAYSLRVNPDHSLDIEWVTDAFTTISGYTADEIQARGGWLTLIHPDDKLSALDFACSISTGKQDVIEFRILTKQGETRWLRNHSKPEWNPREQRVTRVLGASRDISARKEADAALRTSESRQRALLNAIPDMMFRVRGDGVYLDFHTEQSSALRIEPDQVIGHTTDQLLPPPVAEMANLNIRRALELGTVQQFEYELPEQDSIHTYEARISVSGPDEVLVIVRDITERKQAEHVLRQQNQYLAALHATTLEIMNRLQVSDVLEAIILRAGTLVGTTHGYIYLVDQAADTDDLVVQVGVGMFRTNIGYRIQRGVGIAGIVWETGQPLAVDNYKTWPSRSPDSTWGCLHAVVGVPLTSANQVIGVIGLAYSEPGRTFGPEQIEILVRFAQLASIALDNARLYTTAQIELAVRKQAEADLALARDQALEVARLKSEFLALMGHELRTPLNAIIGFTDITLEQHVGPLNEVQYSNLTRVSRNARNLLDMINSILDMSKIDAGRMQLAHELVVIEEIVLSAVSSIETLLSSKQLQLTFQQPATAIPPFMGDAGRIHQILLNLLSNAVKFTPSEGTIAVILEWGRPNTFAVAAMPQADLEAHDWLALSVQDTGIGIDAQEHERIWSEFYQIDGSATRQYSGTGLGLAIVKRLALLMGGQVGLRSQPDHGSTFTIWLPLDPSMVADPENHMTLTSS